MLSDKSMHNLTKDGRMIRRKRKFDEVKHLIRKMECVFEIMLLTLTYYLIWRSNYRIESIPQYFGRGKYVLAGVYVILTFVILYACDSLQFGHLKLIDVVISQWIAMCIVNFVTYFQLCLIANHMLLPGPMIILTGIDFIIVLVLVYIFTAIYHRYYIPRNMVLIYDNDNAVNLKFKMDSRPDKYHITKIVNINQGLDTIQREIAQHDAVIINDVPAQVRNDILKYCYRNEVRTYVVPKISDIISRGANEITLFDTPLLLVKGTGLTLAERFVKRILDLSLCFIALIPSIPVMLIVALAIKIEDGGPVFYKQRRVTKGGKVFEILKFRSMVVDAEKEGKSIPATDYDPRITKVGRVIRATRVDELPQIFNILKGEMSIVGPRPERVEHMKKYGEEIPEFAYRTKVKGGLTGYAQIYGKYNTSAYDKIRLDLTYIENYSIFLDIKLILMTLRIMTRAESTEGFDKSEELEALKAALVAEEEGMQNVGK